MAVVAGPVVAAAPVRVADVGGWTDTWFGSPGQVCHLAVGPGVEVRAEVVDAAGAGLGPGEVRLRAAALDADYVLAPHPEAGWAQPIPGEHPLLEHAVGEVLERHPLADGTALQVEITAAVPPGASLGTSASVLVALIGALDALVGEARDPAAVAAAAHRVETARAGREAGVQDQWAAALGGCGLLVVSPYPEVRRTAVELAPPTEVELGERLVTVVFGAHDSSAVHRQVIDAILTCSGPEHDRARQALARLASLAPRAAAALGGGDIDAWAGVLRAATEVQAELAPGLVGAPHRAAIAVAEAAGAAGWKVNGAGGDGGSLTVVAGAGAGAASADELAEALRRVDPIWEVLRLVPAPGLVVRAG